MVEQRRPVPAVPSVVVALGGSLRDKLDWLERRFRSEIGVLYPGNLLRFRLLTRDEQLASEALHTLCDPLLVHPLWLSLRERGLAPGGERGPRLNLYAILSEDDARGCRLLAPLYASLRQLYQGHLVPDLCVFFVGTNAQALPALADATAPLPCFVLGPVKRFGYRTSGRQEPFETIRLALNALLASQAAGEIVGLLAPDEGRGLRLFALGASAIAVARPQMETWLRNTLLQRLAKACLAEEGASEGWPAAHLQAREAVAELFGLEKAESWSGEPDELWEKGLGRRMGGLFASWANEVLQAWGIEVRESRHGHWQPVARAEGDLYGHLEQTLSESGELQGDAQAALTQDIIRLVSGLGRHFERHEQTILARWSKLPARLLAEGPGCLLRLSEIVAAAEAGLNRAGGVLQVQRVRPLWLHGDRDVIALADILAAQMMPVRSAAERARLSFVPPGLVALRLLPFVLLVGAAGADLRPGGLGLLAGLSSATLFGMLAATLQYRRLRRETYVGVRELCRLYEDSIAGLLLSQARNVVRHLQEAVSLSAAQLRAVDSELRALDLEAGRALDELARFPRENTYLERQLSDPAHCARVAGQVPIGELLGEPTGGEAAVGPAEILAATLRGDLPVPALGAGLIEAVGPTIARRGSGMIETRVEEMLVAGAGGPFSAAGTMEGLHQRALPLWPTAEDGGPEVALAVMSREAAVAFQGWLVAHASAVRLLPTLQRDRISYLRLRPLGSAAAAPL